MAVNKKQFQIVRRYETENEIFDIPINFDIDFREIYAMGLAPDDVLAKIIENTDKAAWEIYGGKLLVEQ